MPYTYYEAPADEAAIDHAAAAAASGDNAPATEIRQALQAHRAKLMRELETTVQLAPPTQGLENLRRLEDHLERRIAQEVQHVHDAAVLRIAEATERQSRRLTWATWALVGVTVALAIATLVASAR